MVMFNSVRFSSENSAGMVLLLDRDWRQQKALACCWLTLLVVDVFQREMKK